MIPFKVIIDTIHVPRTQYVCTEREIITIRLAETRDVPAGTVILLLFTKNKLLIDGVRTKKFMKDYLKPNDDRDY